MYDLLVLVPDKNTEFAVAGAITRHAAFGIRPINCTIRVEPGRDGGVRVRGAQLLAVERNRFDCALMILDYEGSGTTLSPLALESELDAALAQSWGPQGKAIVIEPEVDVWMWGAETHLQEVVGWTAELPIRAWLESQGSDFMVNGKPQRPKEALQRLFEEAGLPRSALL